MKIYSLPKLADSSPDGTYLLGPEDASGAVYMLWGRLRPGEKERRVEAREGSAEIVCVVKGNLLVRHGKSSFSVSAGEAFRSRHPDVFLLDNNGAEEAVYITAGGGAARKAEPKKETAPEAIRPQEPQEEETDFIITRDDSNEGQ